MAALNNRKYLPLILTLTIVLLDQAAKALIVLSIPEGRIGAAFFGDFFRIIHVRNLGVVFSLGHTLPDSFRAVLFKIIPLIGLGFLFIFLFKSRDLTPLQRWSLSGILGGGIGNLADRIFRPGGVVDFLDFKFYGLFGLNRWPTFNLADASLVVFGILFVLSMLFGPKAADEKSI